MDRSATPWRVLDEADPAAAAEPAGGAAEPRGGSLAGVPWRLFAGVGLAVVLTVAAFAVAAGAPNGEVTVDGGVAWTGSASPSSFESRPEPSGLLVIDVQGAVLRPGVLRLPAGARVGDAIEAAGGYGPRVDADRAARELNLAALLSDGDRILVPSRDEAPPPSGGGAEAGSGGDGLIDLNTATASELDELPGVGPVTAQKIIDAREEQPFASVDDLLNRKVVGKSAFDKLRELVTVG
jgi:competence protein ComEA